MIVLDIETSGKYADKCGVWQIGAIDLDSMEEFFGESSIDENDLVQESALIVIGRTESELRDKNKKTQKQLLEEFFKWVSGKKIKNMISQCPQILDFPLLFRKAREYGLEFPFSHRCFDLHTIASLKYFQINNKFAFDKGQSDMGLAKIAEFCGLELDKRTKTDFNTGQLVQKGKDHNALEDTKEAAECFSRIVYGKNLLEEYAKFAIPSYLRQ